MKQRKSHGDGRAQPADFQRLGEGVVLEPTALVFHPERIVLGDGVYVGHYAILNGYHDGELTVGESTWIGQHVLLHGAGGLHIGREVGIGPGCRIITSIHADPGLGAALMSGLLERAQVRIGDGSDFGVNAVVLPGVSVGRGVQVGAGAVVCADLPDFCVAAGVPARVVRERR